MTHGTTTLTRAEAFEANSTLPHKLALISKAREVDVVHISTDNVFKCDQKSGPAKLNKFDRHHLLPKHWC